MKLEGNSLRKKMQTVTCKQWSQGANYIYVICKNNFLYAVTEILVRRREGRFKKECLMNKFKKKREKTAYSTWS